VSADPFVDYYELLQISPNADEDTIQRIFRHLAKKLHPDAGTHGDPDRFNRLLEGYRVLTDVSQRAGYDVAYRQHWEQTWKVAAEATDANPISDDARVRVRLLSLFYVQRRRNMRNPGMGQVELEKLLDLSPEHLAFHLWYLREKGWIQRLETGYLAITAEGVDQVERDRVQLDPERLIESRVPGDSRPDPLHAPAKAPQS
jgi:curved DNA-binding protein CbpA